VSSFSILKPSKVWLFLAGLASLSSATSDAQASPLLYSSKPATRLTYELKHETDSTSDFGQAVPESAGANSPLVTSPLSHSFHTSLNTQLTVTILREAKDGFFVCYRFNDPALNLQSLGEVDAAKLDIIRRELTGNTFGLVNHQGRIISLWLDPSLHELSGNFIKAALAVTQFVLPPGGDSSRAAWEVEEEDANGHYVARYQPISAKTPAIRPRESEAVERSFRKMKPRYLPSAGEKPHNGVYEVMPSVTADAGYAGTFNSAEGRLVSLEGSETQSFTVANHNVGTSKVTLNFQFVRSETVDPAELETLRLASIERQANEGERLSTRQSSRATELAFQRKYLGNATLASLLAALDTCDSAGGESETQLYLKVRALAYLEPGATEAMGQLLQTANARSQKAGVLLSALGAVGSNEAQAALVATMRARAEDEPMLQRILLALGECDAPSESTEDALRAWMTQKGPGTIPTAAAQLLGDMARKLAGTSPERASNLIDLLIQNLATAGAPTAKQAALLALGATASERALSEIEQFLRAGDTDMRTVAVVALRPYASAADDLLLRVLHTETNASVRLESALALADHTTTPRCFATQRRLFATEKDSEVRLALLNNVWQARKEFPEAVRIVQRAAKSDTSKQIQQAARTLLTRSS
jgi:hypothetical protein